MSTASTTSATVTPAASQITRDAFIQGLAKRASNGDAAALAILCDPKAQVLNFAEFLSSVATKTKKPLGEILSTVCPESLDWLTKSLPKDSPQSTVIKAALLSSRASLPITVEYHAPGTTQVGFGSNKSPNDIPLITVKGYDHDGKAVSEKKGLRFWSLIIRLADSPEALTSLRAMLAPK